MDAARTAKNFTAYGIYNFDTGTVEPGRFQSPATAGNRAYELRTGRKFGGRPVARKGDGMVREAIGFDANGVAYKLVFNSEGFKCWYTRGERIAAPKTKARPRLTLVK